MIGSYLSSVSAWSSVDRRVVDVAIAAVALVLVEIASWSGDNPVGDRIAGPMWLIALLPLCWAVPLLWRRTHPLLVLCVIWAGVVVQALATWHSPEGLEIIVVFATAVYSAGAYASRSAGWVGLGVSLVGYGVYAAGDPNIRTGRASELWAGAFFLAGVVACWLIGTLVRQRRERLQLTARTTELEASAANAVAEERARLARDLHDIVSHNLSVMVVQAAGARARGSSDAGTLEKIERSGRASLVEMRRLLGVLRAEDEQAALTPQPGIAEVAELVRHVRESGVPVELDVTGECARVPPAIGLSVYRIVQEALTNVVKHAGAAHAAVRIEVIPEAVHIEVRDDGHLPAHAETTGHGLVGMRERVALLHGELRTGPGPDGGFEVRAALPLSATA